VASQQVIRSNAGVLVAQLDKPAQFRGGRLLRFRIDLS
jgi:hypothetical protein